MLFPVFWKAAHESSAEHREAISTMSLAADLRAAGYPIGPENDRHIVEAATRAGTVIVAWGAAATGLYRTAEVLALLRPLGLRLACFGKTQSGQPKHPLYLPNHAALEMFL